ncbi:ATP-dependent metallopeptidase FtsH/Yme1/Tma family protein [Orbus wheelerorum]|uniref:ATP-dependent metallopeptidase FtsH/Yme1/Tma family protein n=1 Tax=Orbus wheelerorum TaxID=3074111 RepID=UPI00370DC88F
MAISITGASVAFFYQLSSTSNRELEVDYTTFYSDLKNDRVKELIISGHKINIIMKNNDRYITYTPYYDNKLVDYIVEHNVSFSGTRDEKPSLLLYIVILWFLFLILSGCLILIIYYFN